jgi:Multicopper oxidase
LNGLAYFPDPSFVPLLVGMYNGEIIVDEDTIERAKTNNGFDNKTGAFVISRNATLEIVLKNQIGEIGISVPHPVLLYYIYLTWVQFHLHGGDFWDLGAGSGPFTDEAFEAHLATMTPVRRDVTILGALPGTGTLDTPEGISTIGQPC